MMKIRPVGASCSTRMDRHDDAVTYHSFANAPKSWISLTFHSVLCVIHAVNSDCFPTQHYVIGRLCGTNWWMPVFDGLTGSIIFRFTRLFKSSTGPAAAQTF